jgi:uncharacterized protein (TIGR02266 family)
MGSAATPDSDSAPRAPVASSDELAAAEAALASREAALLEALDDAGVESEEVLAFAEDVRARLRSHLERDSLEIRAALGRLAGLEPPAVDRSAYEARLAHLRAEALRAREALADAMAAELESVHAAIDQALAEVRAARDVMIRGRLRRPAPDATSIAPPVRVERTTVHAALPIAAPTRAEARPAVHADVSAAEPSSPALRRNLRRRLETDVTFHSASNFYAGFSSNLSDGGLFVATDVDLPMGAELQLTFSLPGGETIDATCVVRWLRPPQPDLPGGLGVEFLDLPELARDAIHRFMRRRDPIFHEV